MLQSTIYSSSFDMKRMNWLYVIFSLAGVFVRINLCLIEFMYADMYSTPLCYIHTYENPSTGLTIKFSLTIVVWKIQTSMLLWKS